MKSYLFLLQNDYTNLNPEVLLSQKETPTRVACDVMCSLQKVFRQWLQNDRKILWLQDRLLGHSVRFMYSWMTVHDRLGWLNRNGSKDCLSETEEIKMFLPVSCQSWRSNSNTVKRGSHVGSSQVILIFSINSVSNVVTSLILSWDSACPLTWSRVSGH